MTAKAMVSVVVLNHNRLRYLDESLASLISQTYSPLEIIVVDNGSTDGSAELAQRRYPQIRWLPLDRNTGFAAGNNRGFEIARGGYIALPNNDAVAAPDWVEKLVAAAERLPDHGMFGSRILLRDPPLEDPAAAMVEFGRILKPGGRLYVVTPLAWEEHQAPHDYFRFTSWVCATC